MAAEWLVACDESGIDGSRYYGFGSLWLAWERRGDLTGQLGEIRARHGFYEELKWNKANTGKYHQFMLDVVDWFFMRRWMAFHCLIVEKAAVNKEFHNGDFDLARRKHFTMLLTNKMKRCMRRHSGSDQVFRVWVDPIASRYDKADEVVEIISASTLRKALPGRCADVKVSTWKSHDADAIQVCDLLLGACVAAWNAKASSPRKKAVQRQIAEHLGWDHLQWDTYRTEKKFNIWMFHDPVRELRKATSKPVKLTHGTSSA
jgi:hypothetical protein